MSEPETFPFEEALAQLEQLVEQMEQGNLTLEESLAAFERGVNLTRQCQVALKTAEQKVSTLLASRDGVSLVPGEPE